MDAFKNSFASHNQSQIIMKPILPSEDNHTPADANERLSDSMLREHARLGTRADESFLQRLHRMAFATQADCCNRRGFVRIAVATSAAVAALALIAGLMWHHGFAGDGGAGVVGGAELTTDLPPENYVGTPAPMDVPRLVPEPTRGPTLEVPEGTELLSRGKPVTSSDDDPIIGTLDVITDGDKKADEGYYVELAEGLQWVQIDLEESADLHAVWIWHYHMQRRAYHDVIVRISDDPDFKRGVVTVFNNDYDHSAGMGKGGDSPYVESRFGLLVDAKGAPGRYVRIYSNGATSTAMNHYTEVEVFGIRR